MLRKEYLKLSAVCGKLCIYIIILLYLWQIDSCFKKVVYSDIQFNIYFKTLNPSELIDFFVRIFHERKTFICYLHYRLFI